MLNEKFLEGIVEDLMGSCQSLEDALDKHYMELDDLSMKDLEYIDDAIFVCDCCGWWYDLGEISIIIEDALVCMGCEENWK